MKSQATGDRWDLAWLLLCLFYLMFAFLYSVIQPLTAAPDETSNMRYIQFLARAHTLPAWVPFGEGGAGPETQHPPFSYSVMALPYTLSHGLAENWRWHLVRWTMVALGLLLFLIARRLARRLFPDNALAGLVLACTILLMPVTLLHLCHANPDGIGLMLSAGGLLLAFRIYGAEEEARWLPWAAGAVAALAALTKLNFMLIVPVLLAAQWVRKGQQPADRLRQCGIIAGCWIAGSGWWYIRNVLLYGTPILNSHEVGQSPTGLQLAGKAGFLSVAFFDLQETLLSTWAQRGWFPAGLDVLLYTLIALVLALSIWGALRWRRASKLGQPLKFQFDSTDDKNSDSGRDLGRFSLIVSAAITLVAFLGQQGAFWFVNAEYNAGGRYMLVALPAIAILIVNGLIRLPGSLSRWALGGWIALLIVMNIASAYNITDVLVPQYHPGWSMFEFPPGVRNFHP